MGFKENMKKYRTKKLMTLEKLADIVGVSKQTIQKYESGVITNVPTDKIEKIAQALNISPGVLMGWESNINIIKNARNEQLIYELLSSHVSESFQKQILEEIEKELNIENRKEKHRLSSKISQDIFAILKTDVKEYFKIYSGKNLTSEEIKKLHEDILKYTMFLLSELAAQK